MTDTTFTAYGINFELTQLPYSSRWFWDHMDDGRIAHGSIELHGHDNAYFASEAEARADAEAYAFRFRKEMYESQSRPHPAVTSTEADDRPVYQEGEIRWQMEKGSERFDFYLIPCTDGEWYWRECNQDVDSQGSFATRFEAQADVLRYVREWMNEEQIEEEERLAREERRDLAFDCYHAIRL